MHDQGVIGRAALGYKNFRYGSVIGGVGRQSVNGLSGKADQMAVKQSLCSLRDGSMGGTQNHGDL
jgi:hypothetical protein